ncbi:MAG: (2Fe-2S) ferredoxin domain-containing protein [Marinifilaceae bacterium]
MEKIKSIDELIKFKEKVKLKLDLREKCYVPENIIQIKVAMATCGIVAGAKEIMVYILEQIKDKNIDAIVSQTGCMTYCYAEPTIEITKPGEDPVVFGYVDKKKVDEILDIYILKDELIDGVIPAGYKIMNK